LRETWTQRLTKAQASARSRAAAADTRSDWWPNQLDIQVLHHNSNLSDPMGEAFDYAEEFKTFDLNAIIKDLQALMTNLQEWWPETSATMLDCSSVWRGTARARTASPTAAAAPAPASSVLRH
jgi:catalase (peroxidase I)